MKQLPLVSTLICTYNAEKFISMTLDSVVWQTYKNQEILILDNGSKDSTIQIIKSYQKRYPQITLFDLAKNLWAYVGLNYLLDKAKGQYIAIQDHDDIWHSQKLEKQVDFLERYNQYVGCGTGTLMYYGKSQLWFYYDTKESSADRVIHTSLLFKNAWFRYDVTKDFLCDSYFMKKILCKNQPLLWVVPLPLTLHYYKQTGTNYSEQWFKINRQNIKRYFDVYGYRPYFIFLFVYLLFCKLLPPKFKAKFDFMLLCRIKWAQKKSALEQENVYTQEMLRYYA